MSSDDWAICPGRENDTYRRARVAYARAVNGYWERLTEWEHSPVDKRAKEPPTEPPAPELPDPVMGDPIWCPQCVAGLRKRLSELDDLAGLVASMADGMRGANDQDKVGGSRDPASPSPLQDMLDAMYRELIDLEDWHRDEVGYPKRPHRANAGARQITVVTAWVGAHLGDILRMPGATDAGKLIMGWHRRLQETTRSKPELIRRPARCPRCERRALRKGDDGITKCENCGRWMNDEEYDELAEAEAKGQAS